MHTKLTPAKPFVVMLYGFPGAGKTTFARQFSEEVDMAHVQADKIIGELLGGSSNNQDQERKVAEYMTREFLRAGVSVLYDATTARTAQRRAIREVARQAKAPIVLVWLQIDPETAYMRTQSRDRRKSDDKFSKEYTVESFQTALEKQQNPGRDEDYIVVSGKHTFNTQRAAVMKRLYQLNLMSSEQLNQKVVKPGLTNLIPKTMIDGRGDMIRRNISIRG